MELSRRIIGTAAILVVAALQAAPAAASSQERVCRTVEISLTPVEGSAQVFANGEVEEWSADGTRSWPIAQLRYIDLDPLDVQVCGTTSTEFMLAFGVTWDTRNVPFMVNIVDKDTGASLIKPDTDGSGVNNGPGTDHQIYFNTGFKLD